MTMKGAWEGECFTPGCTTTGAMGMRLATPAGAEPNRTHRCKACLHALDVLMPDVPQRLSTLKLIDLDAYSAWASRVAAMDHDELHAEAAPLLRRERSAYKALTRLLDMGNPQMVRDLVAVLVGAADLVSEATVTNWWAAHCHGRHDQAKQGGGRR